MLDLVLVATSKLDFNYYVTNFQRTVQQDLVICFSQNDVSRITINRRTGQCARTKWR